MHLEVPSHSTTFRLFDFVGPKDEGRGSDLLDSAKPYRAMPYYAA